MALQICRRCRIGSENSFCWLDLLEVFLSCENYLITVFTNTFTIQYQKKEAEINAKKSVFQSPSMAGVNPLSSPSLRSPPVGFFTPFIHFAYLDCKIVKNCLLLPRAQISACPCWVCSLCKMPLVAKQMILCTKEELGGSLWAALSPGTSSVLRSPGGCSSGGLQLIYNNALHEPPT